MFPRRRKKIFRRKKNQNKNQLIRDVRTRVWILSSCQTPATSKLFFRLCTSGLCYKVNYMWSSLFLFTVFQAHIHWRARFHAVHQRKKLKRSLSTQHENRGYRELVVDTHTHRRCLAVFFFFCGKLLRHLTQSLRTSQQQTQRIPISLLEKKKVIIVHWNSRKVSDQWNSERIWQTKTKKKKLKLQRNWKTFVEILKRARNGKTVFKVKSISPIFEGQKRKVE